MSQCWRQGRRNHGGYSSDQEAITPLKFRSRELSPALFVHAGYEKIPIWLHVRHQLNKLRTDFIIVLNAAAIYLARSAWVTTRAPMADTQRRGRVRLQNTAQQIRPRAILLFWLKTDLSEPWIVKHFLGENAPRPPWILRGYARIRHSAPLTWSIFCCHHR